MTLGRVALVVALLCAGLILGGATALAQTKGSEPAPLTVSGERALGHVRALVKFGERSPGSDGHRRAQRYILRQLRLVQAEVEEFNFLGERPYPKGLDFYRPPPVPMKNIIAKIPGWSQDIVVLAGHYDTKELRGFVGANDGGSSTALLLELVRVLARQPNSLTVWVVFFDGEEAFREFSDSDGLFGSRTQVSAWERAGLLPRLKAVLVVDMIGDKELALRRELYSTSWLTDFVWQVARDKGHQAHFLEEPTQVTDDHLPFVRAGVPAVDLIDLDYGPGNRYWHTPADTVDKLSPRSFEVIGEVVLEAVARLGQRWPGEVPPR